MTFGRFWRIVCFLEAGLTIKSLGCRSVFCLVGGLALGVADASAQPARSLAELQPKLKIDNLVTVTDDKGVVFDGVVTAFTADRLEIRGLEQPTTFFGKLFNSNWNKKSRTIVFTDASLRRIKTPDTTWDGMFIGVGIGALMGVAVCSGRNRDETCPLPILGLAAVGGYFGNEFDSTIDATIYRSTPAPHVSLTPLFTRHGAGFGAVIRWSSSLSRVAVRQ